MHYNIFFFLFVGSDICGFINPTSPVLCTRWTGVGVFYPFARNHNNINTPDQEPYVFMNKDDPKNVVTLPGGEETTHGAIQRSFI